MAVEVEHADQAPGTDRQVVLGSFALVRRMPPDPAERPGYLVAEAIGQAGVAIEEAISTNQAAENNRPRAALATRRWLKH